MGRTSFAGCRKVVAVVEDREVAVEGMEVVAGCIDVGAGIDSEERRSPGFEEEEFHSLVLVGLLGVRSWAEEDIAADLGADSVVADDLGLVRRNNRCWTSCLLFWGVLGMKGMRLG